LEKNYPVCKGLIGNNIYKKVEIDFKTSFSVKLSNNLSLYHE